MNVKINPKTIDKRTKNGEITCIKKLTGKITDPNFPSFLLKIMSLLYQNILDNPWPLLTFWRIIEFQSGGAYS